MKYDPNSMITVMKANVANDCKQDGNQVYIVQVK